MRIIGALSAAVLVYLAAGLAFGITPKVLSRRSTGRRRAAQWQDWLNQAGVAVSPAQFVAVSLGVGLVVGLLVGAFTGAPAIGLVSGVAVSSLPRALFARRARSVHAERVAAWPDALRDIVAHLRASMSIHASLSEISNSGPIPLRDSFSRYVRLAEALDHKSALEVVREDLADPLSDRIIEILLVAYDQGTSVVVDILESLAESTSSDLSLIEEMETAQLETKLEARGAAILPLVVLGLLCASTPGYRAFYSTLGGWLVIGFGSAMSIVGLVAIERLGKMPTEARILAGGGEQ